MTDLTRQNRFIQSLEGIGDILVFEAGRKGKNRTVIEGLGKIQEILEAFFNLQDNNPDRFNELILDPAFAKLLREDPQEAGARLAFFPERQLVSFTIALQQLQRIHEAAISANNDEISRQATVHLVRILLLLTSRPHNDTFVKQLLRSLHEVAQAAIRDNDSSMYSAAISWYFTVVFRSELRLEYVETLTSHFRETVRLIIENNQWDLYKAAVSSLLRKFIMPVDETHDLWDYLHLWIRYQDFRNSEGFTTAATTLETLTQEVKQITSNEEYDAWVQQLLAFDATLSPYLNEAHQEQRTTLLTDLKAYAASVFTFNVLREAVFALGAFMVREQRGNYIRHLWEFKQPADAEAVWVGHEVTPTSVEELVSLYFSKGHFDRTSLTRADNRGSRVYYQRYFLLRLAKLLEPVIPAHGRYPTIEALNLPPFSIHQLSHIESAADDLTAQIPALRADTHFLESVGFVPSKIAETFDNTLPAFLRILKQKATDRLAEKHRSTPLDAHKVAEFKDKVAQAFEESVSIRRILQHFNRTEDHSEEALPANAPEGQFAIRQIDDKAAFFTEWYSHYVNWGENYGESLALSEDNHLVNDILAHAAPQEQSLDQSLDALLPEAQPFIIADHMTAFETFEQHPQFLSRWMPNVTPLTLSKFEGWYTRNDRQVPVFTAHVNEGLILLLDANRLGTFIQYAPGFAPVALKDRRGALEITVRAYSANPALLQATLDQPMPWLAKEGDRAAQERYLQDKVLVEVIERFAFLPDANIAVQSIHP